MANQIGLEDVEYMKCESLLNILKDDKQKNNKDYIVIDVRDNDIIGGHIINSINIQQINIEKHWVEIINKYNSIPLIIFHCQYSEIRAPATFQRYKFLKKSIIDLYKKKCEMNKNNEEQQEMKKDEVENDKKSMISIKFQQIEFDLNDEIIQNLSKQKFLVLEGGFYGWVSFCLKNKDNLQFIQDFDKNMYCSK